MENQSLNSMEIANGMQIEQVAKASSNHKVLLSEITEMKQRGEVSSPEFLEKMRQLEILLGINQISPFGTNDVHVFENRLNEMTKTDMERIARKIGLNPIHQRAELKKALLREFNYYTRGTARNIMPESTDTFTLDRNNPKHQELIKILEN